MRFTETNELGVKPIHLSLFSILVEEEMNEKEVEAMITLRLIMFHDALVERGQIAPAPKPADPVEFMPDRTVVDTPSIL
jgi:hypothetical protein